MATDVKVLTAESSPTDILASLSRAENKKWRETGEFPDREATPPKESKTENAESSPAAKTDVTEPDAKKAEEKTAESVPANREPKAKGAEARIKELLADNKRLNAELETARKAPVVAPAKIEEIAKPHRADVDEKTGQPKYATDEAFEQAHEDYITAKVTKDVEKRQAKAQEDVRIAEQNRLLQQKWQNSLKIAIERHPDFAKVCEIDAKGAFQNAELKGIRSNGMLDAFCLDSEIGGQILYYLASHPGEVKRIDSLSSFAAARELTKLEDKLFTESSAPTQPEKKEDKPEGSKAKVTGAPAPAASVSGRATAPVDEQAAAIAAGDQRRYMKAANEEEFRNRKKG